MFDSTRHAMSTNHILRSSRSSKVKSGFLAEVVFLILYSKSQISFFHCLSSTVSFCHVILYHTAFSSSSRLPSFPILPQNHQCLVMPLQVFTASKNLLYNQITNDVLFLSLTSTTCSSMTRHLPFSMLF